MGISENNYPVVCFGESSWVVLPGGAHAGGYPANIACHLKALGVNPAVITRVGLDDQGKRLIGFMEGRQIATDFFQVDYEALTGSTHAGYPNASIFHPGYHPQAWDNIAWDSAFEQLISTARFFVHGTLPARSSVSRNTLYQFMETGIQRVFDINLRTPFYSKSLIQDCLTESFILTLNTEELELITGWFASFSSPQERMQVLQDRFRIPYIILSRGLQGCLINVRGSLYEHKGFGENEAETTASEEAFVAGLLYQFLQNENPGNIIGYACALRSFVAFSGGAPYDPVQIHQIMCK